jgi:membrane-bound serine protease (ClpP class)
MDWLQNANIIYLLLVGGLALGVLALAAPGTGVFEVIAILILGLAGWLIAAAGLPINLWSLGILLVGAALFVVAVRRPRQVAVLLLSILALVAGSAYLFAGAEWWLPGVNPALAAMVSILLGGFFWLAARKAIEAEMVRPSHDLSGLIGAIGETRSPIAGEGTVYADGELWSARSAGYAGGAVIPADTQVRIIGREGFTLIVEPAVPPAEAPPAEGA